MLLVIAIMVVYIVLGILYESYIHPLTILSGLPSAGFGALLTLWLFHMDLNIYAFVGLIMLIGIVKKNAIMQIDFALEAERGGMTAEGGDLPGLPDPLPPDHDDHDGGAAGRGADRARLRRGRRSAAAARPVRGRRTALLAAVTLYLTPVFYIYLGSAQSIQPQKAAKKQELAPVAGD